MATFAEIRANRKKKKKAPRSTAAAAKRNGRVVDPSASLGRTGPRPRRVAKLDNG